jgi:hypothetical protein
MAECVREYKMLLVRSGDCSDVMRCVCLFFSLYLYGSTAPWGPRPPHSSRLHDHTHFRHTTVGRTPLDEWSTRRRDLYLTTHNTHNRQTSMPPVGFFFCLSGVFPLWSTFVLFKSFRPSCHFTFHATVLTTNTTQTSMPPVGFESTVPVSERPKTRALDRTATEIGNRTHSPMCHFSTRCQVMAFPVRRASRSHSNTPHSVGLLWMSDQLVAETSTWQHTTL